MDIYKISFEFNLYATLMMTSLIWFVQLIAYPAYYSIEEKNFKYFHSLHTTRITFIVGPLMLVELLSSLVMLYENLTLFEIINTVTIILLWLSTAFVSVPLHNKLSQYGKDSYVIKQLVQTNWIRTFLWSARSIALLFIIFTR